MPDKRYSGPFNFSLLPPKSEKEIALEVERDDSILYSMLLVFVAGLTFFGLTMANILFIDPRVQQFQTAVNTRAAQVVQYADTRNLNGELYVKTRTLLPVLDKKIDTTEIFRVADAITAINTSLTIESYSRERTGLFVFEVATQNTQLLPNLAQGIKQIEGVSQVFVRSTRNLESLNKFVTTVALSIDAV